MLRRSRPLLSVLTAAFILLGAGGATVHGQTPPAVPPSSDELLLSILPYRLQQADVPAGFSSFGMQAASPARRAFIQGEDLEDSQNVLKSYARQGYLIGFEQVFGPDTTTPIRIFNLGVELYTTEAKASAAFHDDLDVPSTRSVQSDNPALPVSLGAESGAVHLVSTDSSGQSIAFEAALWRRGRVVFTAVLEVFDATETLDQVIPFAQNADRHAASVTPPAPSATATLPAAGSDAYRVEAMYALYVRLPGQDLAPFGFRARGRTIVDNSDLLLAATDARAAYDRINGRWKRVTEVERTYDTLQGADYDAVHVRLALSADTNGAVANLLEPDRVSTGTLDTYSLPKPFGDTGRVYHEGYVNADGVPRESWRATWTRGRVVLSVYTTGPAGDFAAQRVTDLAALVDANYQKGALPTVLTTATPEPAGP